MKRAQRSKRRVNDLCEITSSKRIFAADYQTEGVPFFRGKEITEKYNGAIEVSTELFIERKKFEDIKAKSGAPMPGDLLLTSVGTLGSTYVVRRGDEFYFKDGNITWFRDFRGLDSNYFHYWLTAPDGRAELKKCTIGSSQSAYTISLLKGIEIELPSLSEQRRIASILSAYDDLIENNTRRIAILEEMARRIYEEWFVRFRFPGHEGVRMVESALGLVPEGWEITTLGQLAEINARTVRRGAEPVEIRYVDISSVSTGSIDNKEQMLFSDAPGRARRIVQDGDVIWSCVRPNRKSYSLVVDPEPNLLVSTGFVVISPVAAPSSFIYQCVTTDNFVSHLVNHAKGAAYPAVCAEDFGSAKVLIPINDLVAAFDRIAQPMLRLISALQLKNCNLRTTRDLLLPKLISGEIDVSTLAEAVAVAA